MEIQNIAECPITILSGKWFVNKKGMPPSWGPCLYVRKIDDVGRNPSRFFQLLT